MKSKKNFKNILLGFTLLILLLIIIINSEVGLMIKDKIEEIMFIPKKWTVANVKYFDDTKNSFINSKILIEENKKLKEENMKLIFSNEMNNFVLNENERLLSLLNMKSKNFIDSKNIKAARVIFISPDDFENKFYIDKGTKDGINQDMIAVYNSSLIGKIVKVSDENSLVLPLTSGKLEISAKVKDKDYIGIVNFNLENRQLEFRMSSPENVLERGDKIYTSGIGDVYPENIYIGSVDYTNDKTYIIKPDYDLQKLNEILIIDKKSQFIVPNDLE